jgi:hypothetical protein
MVFNFLIDLVWLVQNTYSHEHQESQPADRRAHRGISDHGVDQFCAFRVFKPTQVIGSGIEYFHQILKDGQPPVTQVLKHLLPMC